MNGRHRRTAGFLLAALIILTICIAALLSPRAHATASGAVSPCTGVSTSFTSVTCPDINEEIANLDRQGIRLLASVAGTNTITANASPYALTAYADGQTFRLKPANNNTSTVTLNINSLGAKAIVKQSGSALASGDLQSSTIYVLQYYGSDDHFRVLGAVGTPGVDDDVPESGDFTNLTGGSGIDNNSGTLDLDLTEINSATWGAGSFTALTFNAGAVDPVLTFGSGTVTWSAVTTLNLDDEGEFRFFEEDAGGSNYVGFKAPAAITSNVTCTFENDSSPIPDSCVGDGSDAAGLVDADYGDITVSGTGTVMNIDSGVIGTAEIATDGVDSAEIAANAVGSSEIATDAVDAAEIAADAVRASEIQADAVGDSELDGTAAFDITGTLTLDSDALRIDDTNASHQLIITPGSDLTANRVFTLATGDAARTLTMSANATLNDADYGDITTSSSFTSWQIDADAVGASEIAANSVANSEMADNAIGNAEMADNAIGAAEIIDDSITVADLDSIDAPGDEECATYEGGAIEWQTCGGAGVSDGDKGDITVGSSGADWQIDADTITTTELADNAVALANVADDAIGLDEIDLVTGDTPSNGDCLVARPSGSGGTVEAITCPGAGGGIGNVVEDTTPQAGGAWDWNGQSQSDSTLTDTLVADYNENALRLTNDAAGATGALLELHHDSASPADGDIAGALDVYGGADDERVGSIRLEIDDGATTTEDTRWRVTTRVAGADVEALTILGDNVTSAGDFTSTDDVIVGDDLTFATGAVIDWAASDCVLTHSSNLLSLTGSCDLRTDVAGTNSASVVTVGGTQTLTGKSIVATQITAGALNIGNNAATVGTVELGNGTDATVARTGAGEATLEGDAIKHAGKQMFWVGAGAFKNSALNPASCGDAYDSGSNDVSIFVCAFDTGATEENAEVGFAMPKGWNESTITMQVAWTNTGGASAETVQWKIACTGFGDDDALNTAYPADVTVSDTWTAQNDYTLTAETSAITVQNAAENDWVNCRIGRDTSVDNMAGDALLIGIKVYWTDNASTLAE